MSRLEIRGLIGGYGGVDHVVKGVDLAVDRGELHAVIGPNGAGKSTALKLAAGLLKPKAGAVRLDGAELAGQSPQTILAAGLVFVPQERNVFGALSVEENLAMGVHIAPKRFKERRDAVFALLPLLAERRRQLARTLSGGQRQLLAMGVALMAKPRVLALDEPTAGLSPKAADELFATVRKLAAGEVAVVMVEQNAIDALHIADRATLMVDGRVAREDEARALAADDDIRRLFLGGRKPA